MRTHLYAHLPVSICVALLLTAFAAMLGVRTAGAAAPPKEEQTPADRRESKNGDGVLYHVVSLKFKETATPEQIKDVEEAFVHLKTAIPGINALHWGTNVSPEQHDKGFTHCFVLTFGTDKDRDAYLIHPDHKAFGKLLGPIMADVFVIDFWSKV